MGDHRANIKIEMEFHGIKNKCDMWINYVPNDSGVDERVINFISDIYERGMEKYNALIEKHWREQHKEEIENREKRELRRLKEKYENWKEI